MRAKYDQYLYVLNLGSRGLTDWHIEYMKVHPHQACNTRRVLRQGLPIAVPQRLDPRGLVKCRAVDIVVGNDVGYWPASRTLAKLRPEDIWEAIECGKEVRGHLCERNGAALLGGYFGLGLQEDGLSEGGKKGVVYWFGERWGWVDNFDDLLGL